MCADADPHVIHALALVAAFMEAEKGSPRGALQPRALRRLVQLSSEPDLVRRRCVCAAFGLLAAGLELNADDIAWLVRDRDIGFPEQPSFDG